MSTIRRNSSLWARTARLSDSRPSTLDTLYTCPMHPEIEQDHPGTCPKCGMALEPKTITAGAGRRQRAARHDAAILVRLRARAAGVAARHAAHARRAAGPLDFAGDFHLAAIRAGDAGRAVGRLAAAGARLAIDREPASQYVYADRHRRRRGVPLQRGRDVLSPS